MASTYVNDLRLNEMATGDESGNWGVVTNTNLELIGEALGYGTEGITTNADTHTSTIADGATDPARAMYLKYTGTLDSACTITIAPNTISRMQFIENGTTGSQNIMAIFASTSAADGAKVFKKCAACHSVNQGGSNKIGPALWGVLGRQVGSVADYKYSKAMAAYEKNWSFEEMDGFLLKPKEWIKGTKMSFAGLKNDKERAAVILYLNENTENPLPIQ